MHAGRRRFHSPAAGITSVFGRALKTSCRISPALISACLKTASSRRICAARSLGSSSILYLKIPPYGADVDVAMRLGGYANLTRGKAFFHDPGLSASMRHRPARRTCTISVRFARLTLPARSAAIGHFTLPILMLAIAAVVGWRLFMFEAHAGAAATVQPQRQLCSAGGAKKSERRG